MESAESVTEIFRPFFKFNDLFRLREKCALNFLIGIKKVDALNDESNKIYMFVCICMHSYIHTYIRVYIYIYAFSKDALILNMHL